MEKDLHILRNILKDLHYTESYSDVLLNRIIEKFNDSSLDEITPTFIFYTLAYDEGKNISRKIADMFEHKKTHQK